ncbi:MAG TPA: TlpA disulfide reductase family protein [Bryobacteraceae bacterium]|nr:TlpA disulfide reductase family protein [Bryobacteraceae bacterium]
MFRRLLVLVCLVSFCFAQPAPKRRRCPDTIIRTVDAKPIKISQYRGKVVLIVMFLTSCDDCAQALKLIQKIQNDYASQGLQVVGVSLDESSANLLPFQQRYRFTFPLGHLDKAGAIELAALSKDAHPYVPLVMFVDWMGNVRFQYQGNDPFLRDPDKNLRAIATGLLKQAAAKEGPQYETKPAAAKP